MCGIFKHTTSINTEKKTFQIYGYSIVKHKKSQPLQTKQSFLSMCLCLTQSEIFPFPMQFYRVELTEWKFSLSYNIILLYGKQ